MTHLDETRQHWHSWGIYSKAGHCGACGQYDYIRSRKPDATIGFLCFQCFRELYAIASASMKTTGRFTMLEPT